MRPIPYGQWQRWADARHGRRDGRAGIPAPLPPGAPGGPVTTPHREALIRQARDAFAYEHLQYRTLVAEPHRRIMAGRTRQAAAQCAADWASLALDMESGVPAGPEIRRRRLGEEHHPETVIVQRRRREHHKQLDRARQAVASARASLAEADGDLEQVLQEARQHHEAAVVRVQRIHEHIHRRLAVYRRALVRSHPDGAWVNMVLSVAAPEIPGWALPDAHGPGGVPAPPPAADQDSPASPRPATEPPAQIIELKHEITRFGSARHEDGGGVGYVQLDAPVAAGWHFTIIKADGRLRLETRGQGHGPYVGGEPVGSAIVEVGEFFDFAGRRYTMVDADHLEDAPLGACDLIVADLFARSGAKTRLAEMSFVQREKTLLAILGRSGAGKSSLFAALLGELATDRGRLFFRELPMATHARQIREDLGFVPQQIELHITLTVEATLRYGFGLRSPAGRGLRDEAVDRVLTANKLQEQRGQLLSTLSGGQLRRVSIALELLTDPKLLLLDEPTSGLDASMDRMIMTSLHEHAAAGRTVVVVTHATEHLNLAGQILVVAQDGAPAYSGPPSRIQQYFGFTRYADLLEKLEKPGAWVDRYRNGPMARDARHEAEVLEQQLSAAFPAAAGPARRASPLTFRAARHQLRVLLQRQCKLLLTRAHTKNTADRSRMDRLLNALIVSLPLTVGGLAAALAAVVAGPPGLAAQPSLAGPNALALLTTLCVLSGQALTYSDVVSELAIIRREFRAGVSALQVLTAKWLVYAVLAVAQAGLITVVFCLIPSRAPARSLLLGPELDLFLGLAALSAAAMTLGLLVSALATKLEHAVALITATSIVQIALNGITSDLSTTPALGAGAALLPDRWGLAAAASSIDLRGINDKSAVTSVSADALWSHSLGQWSWDMAALAILSAVFFALAAWRLHARLRPPAARRRGPRQLLAARRAR
jgi:ABC transport system ATP-binding/permease protein